jgi:hypothetical protein
MLALLFDVPVMSTYEINIIFLEYFIKARLVRDLLLLG